MKKLSFLIVFASFQLCAQSGIKPTIGVNYSYELEWFFERIYANKIDLSGGIRIKEHLFFNVSLGAALSENSKGSSLKIVSLTNSIGIDY